MFYHDGGKLQFEVKVEKPNPVFANALQQAIGGIHTRMLTVLVSGLGSPWTEKIPGYALRNGDRVDGPY